MWLHLNNVFQHLTVSVLSHQCFQATDGSILYNNMFCRDDELAQKNAAMKNLETDLYDTQRQLEDIQQKYDHLILKVGTTSDATELAALRKLIDELKLKYEFQFFFHCIRLQSLIISLFTYVIFIMTYIQQQFTF